MPLCSSLTLSRPQTFGHRHRLPAPYATGVLGCVVESKAFWPVPNLEIIRDASCLTSIEKIFVGKELESEDLCIELLALIF
jgi:hypothetical protein